MNAIKISDLPNGKTYDSFKIQILPVAPNFYEIKDESISLATILFKKNETEIISSNGVEIVSSDNWQEIVNAVDTVIYDYLFPEK